MLLLVGKTIEEIISQNHNKWLKKRKEEIVKWRGALSQVDMFIRKQYVNTVKYIDQMIGKLDVMIRGLVDE